MRFRRSTLTAVVTAAAMCTCLGACGSRVAADQHGGRPSNTTLEPLPDASEPSVPAGACTGLKNTTGITAQEITIANASDISGPVPGLFSSAQQGVKAFVAYFNASHDICGRKLTLLPLDSRTDTGGDAQASTRACQQAFALVGSMSAFDQGGTAAVSGCGIPDLRAATVNPDRGKSPVTYGVNSLQTHLVSTAVPDYFKATYPDAAAHAAFLYLDAGSAKSNGLSDIAGWRKRGFSWAYTQAVDVGEFNYAPYVLRMKQKGVRYVQFIGPYQFAVRLAIAMQQQGFKPDAFVLDATAYNPEYVKIGRLAVEGTKVFVSTALFEEARSNPELRLYTKWLQQVEPDAKPTFDGMFAWSAARLFTEQAIRLGGKLTRQSLLAAVAGVHDWTGHGLFAPQDVGGRRTGACAAVLSLKDGNWVRESKGRYLCGELIDTGVGR